MRFLVLNQMDKAKTIKTKITSKNRYIESDESSDIPLEINIC